MKLSVSQARSLAKLLNDSADNAEAAHQTEVDLLSTLEALDDDARADQIDTLAQLKQK